NIEPDVLIAGKSIGGGFPVSLTAFTNEIGGKLKEGDHGSTFGGNPLALRALSAAIETLLEERIVERVVEIGQIFKENLRKVKEEFSDVVREVKGRGLMLGLELRFDPREVIKKLQENNIITLRAGKLVVRFLPPYMITTNDIDSITESLIRVFMEIRREKVKTAVRAE
ncbi:MAG: aminotransferase class III-fold pyridoxal phosphate-dependent enzyme, partial [Nitrososphaerota archaeon]